MTIPTRSGPNKTLLASLAIILLALIAYSSSYTNGYIWDDNDYVTENKTLTSVEGLKQIWLDPGKTPQYYPMVHSSYWLEYRIWQLNPMGYHIVNTLLHGLAAMLLYRVLKRLKLPGAWLAAAIFAVHPVTVESVAWITERKNVLSAVFYFLSLLAFLKAVSWSDDGPRQPTPGRYVISIGFFICALLSKTVTCSLPAVIILLFWWRRKRLTVKDQEVMYWLIPYFYIGAALAIITVRLERQQVGAQGMEWNFSLIDRCLIAGRSLFFYMQKIVYPRPLIFFYERWTIDSSVWWQYLFPVGFGVLLAGLIVMSKRWGRGIPAGLMIFAGTLLPALGFFNVYPHRYSFVADHFQYLASAAFIAVLVGAAATGLSRLKLRQSFTYVNSVVCGILLTVLMGQTFFRCFAYKDERTLWVNTLNLNKKCWAAYNNLGIILFHERKLKQAEGCFLQTIRYKPDHAKAYSHLGWLYDDCRRDAEAEAMFKKAIDLQPTILNFRVLQGNYFAKRKRFREAMAAYRTVLMVKDPEKIENEFFLSLVGAGNIFMELEQFAKAEMLYSKALNQRPRAFLPRLYRSRARISLKRLTAARADLTTLSKLAKQNDDNRQKQQVSALMKQITNVESADDPQN